MFHVDSTHFIIGINTKGVDFIENLMMSYQHQPLPPSPPLPPHIPFMYSRYGLITGQLFAINSVVCFAGNYTCLGALLAGLYVTTMLHWYDIKKSGIVRTLDILFAVATVSRITFWDSYHIVGDGGGGGDWAKQMFDLYCGTSCAVFLTNEYHFMTVCDNDEPTPTQYACNVSIHLLFLHIMPNVMCIWWVLHPNNQPTL